MRINLNLLSLLSCAAAGLSSHLQEQQSRNEPDQSLIEQNRLAVEQMPPACNLVACIGISGTLSCVLSAVGSGDTNALRRCLSGGLGQICSCASCIPRVSTFLESIGICVTSGTPNTEAAATAIISAYSAALSGLCSATATPTPKAGASVSKGFETVASAVPTSD